ncbi:MAG: serine/threonine-protein kinase RsbW [Sphingobacteriales bacterium]|jgi:serine/threonine-protein kinase RsbW
MNTIPKNTPGSKELFTLQLQSKLESITELENLIENLKERFAIGEEYFGNIMIALSEAVINAINHGNKLNPNKKVYINLEVNDGRQFIFTVADEGDGFDYENIPDPTLPENIENPSGRGVFIMKNLADQFIFSNAGSEIELHFKI